MAEKIQFNIPLTETVLKSTAKYLTELAEQVALGDGRRVCAPPAPPAPPAPQVAAEPPAPPAPPAPTVAAEPPAPTVAAEPPAPPAPLGVLPQTPVELADGIPWDERIHSSGKTKYATAPFGWKLKRGLDKDLVARVTAELRALAQAHGVQATGTGTISTFGELVTAITAAGIPEEEIKELLPEFGI